MEEHVTTICIILIILDSTDIVIPGYIIWRQIFLGKLYLHDNKPKQNISYSYNSKASLLKSKQTKSHFKKKSFHDYEIAQYVEKRSSGTG